MNSLVFGFHPFSIPRFLQRQAINKYAEFDNAYLLHICEDWRNVFIKQDKDKRLQNKADEIAEISPHRPARTWELKD
jgi:hypothetical protein